MISYEYIEASIMGQLKKPLIMPKLPMTSCTPGNQYGKYFSSMDRFGKK